MQNLYEKIENQKDVLKNFNPEICKIPKYISENLKYEFFDWQKNAMENLLTFEAIKEKEGENKETHLLFNMATGTGKTLVMAGTILHYYQKGYRHFLFFVNQNNIVDKTENNFIDNTHTKYLFKDKIVIDDKTVYIKKVETFSENPENIEIKFTTVQKFYNDIHLERENQTTLEDLQKLDLVLLADEGHHLNANTKNIVIQEQLFNKELKGSTAEKEKLGWEHTVIEYVLKKYDFAKREYAKENNNVLLEFTATVPDNANVYEKYSDKMIAKFDLKQFLQAGFTKEINLLSSSLDKKERIIQTLIFAWYRHQIALKHNIANFKGVVLFRSKTIEESKQDFEEFLALTDSLSEKDFVFLQNIEENIFTSEKKNTYEMWKSRIKKILKYIRQENILYVELINWIKNNFAEKNTIITNSKDKKAKGQKGGEKTTDDQDKLINNLEDKNNHIRAIFTVDRLTEGWDVLNLFDIVRLYQWQNAGWSDKKTPEATTKEKQLIGRGVRYFPFTYGEKLKNKRKFDDDLDNELRILEELYYHTFDEQSRYISHLKAELKKDGYIKDERVMKKFALKDEFTKTDFYKKVKIWQNKQIENPNRKKKNLEDVKRDFSFYYEIPSFSLQEQEVNFETKEDIQRIDIAGKKRKTETILFKDIENHIFRKAINIKAKQENSLFRFENLQKELDIKSIDDLQKSEFLGDFTLSISFDSTETFEKIDGKRKLTFVLQFLEKVFKELMQDISPKIGSKEFFAKSFAEIFSEPKIKSIDEKNLDDSIAQNNNWYILDGFVGTSEEKSLVEFIQNSIGNLSEKYEQYYLLRNEEIYKIFDFQKGRGFQPDFLLFLKGKDNMHYQIFIEPKGENLIEHDKWKEYFLKEIASEHKLDEKMLQLENREYKLVGLPFFNVKNNNDFEKWFKQFI